jgi:uncharacterized membrane protein
MRVSQDGTEMSLVSFLKATIVGGLLFLLPLILVVVLLGHAMRLAGKATRPVLEFLKLDTAIGSGGEIAVAVLALILISVAAGLVARTRPGRRAMRWAENSVLGGLPQYQLVKSMADGLAQVENAEAVNPALVSIEGGWQIGHLLESLDNRWVAVFLPQAPTPMSGNVMYLPTDRVRPLQITMVQAMAIVKHIGVGSAKALRGADFTLPEGAG